MTIHEWSEVLGKDMARRGEPPPPRGLTRGAMEALQRTLGTLTLGQQEAAAQAILEAWQRAAKGGAPC
jgi:hypothetical protein